MALPGKPLEIDIDANKWSLGDVALFDPEMSGMGRLNGLRKFLIRHSNWTQFEIDAITIAEMEQVTEQLRDALTERAVPLENEKPSEDGPAVNQASLLHPGSSGGSSEKITESSPGLSARKSHSNGIFGNATPATRNSQPLQDFELTN